MSLCKIGKLAQKGVCKLSSLQDAIPLILCNRTYTIGTPGRRKGVGRGGEPSGERCPRGLPPPRGPAPPGRT
jgi:hypothetical protein